jgi:hypothetical protein
MHTKLIFQVSMVLMLPLMLLILHCFDIGFDLRSNPSEERRDDVYQPRNTSKDPFTIIALFYFVSYSPRLVWT